MNRMNRRLFKEAQRLYLRFVVKDANQFLIAVAAS